MSAEPRIQAFSDNSLGDEELRELQPFNEAREDAKRRADGEEEKVTTPGVPNDSTIERLVSSFPRAILENLLLKAIVDGTPLTKAGLEHEADALRKSNFALLPDELIPFIAGFLSLRDRIRMLLCVSRRLRALVGNPALWRRLRITHENTLADCKGGRWIDNEGVLRLFTEIVPRDTIRMLTLGFGLIDAADLSSILARQRTLVELSVHGDCRKEVVLFRNAPKLPDLRVLKVLGYHRESNEELPALSDFLYKLERLECMICDLPVPSALLVTAGLPIHGTLRYLQLGSSVVEVPHVFRLLAVCVALEELAVRTLNYGWEVVESAEIAPNGRPFRDIVIPDQTRERVLQRKATPDGFARLRILTIDWIEYGTNCSYCDGNTRAFAPLAEFLGDHLRSLRVGNRQCLSGDFPELEELYLDCGWMDGGTGSPDFEKICGSVKARFDGFGAPQLETLHHPSPYAARQFFYFYNPAAHELYWELVGIVFGPEVSLRAIPEGQHLMNRSN